MPAQKDPVCGMTVDPAISLSLKAGGRTHYFCSGHCLEIFAKQNGFSDEEIRHCATSPLPKRPFYRDKLFLAAVFLSSLLATSYFFPRMEAFRVNVLTYVRHIWWAVLLGLFLGGLLDRYVPRQYISYVLAKKKKRSILYAVTLGFIMSACSHGILALSMELHRKGASVPVVVSFLLASPWANLPITLMLIGFFGPKAFYMIFGALVIAFNTGLIFQLLELKGWIEANPHTLALEEGFSIVQDAKKRMGGYRASFRQLGIDMRGVVRGAWTLAEMTMGWVILGIALSGLAAAFIPPHIFHQYMGPTILGLLATLLLATVLEVCSEGTSPLAFEIYKQTGAFGNATVFLLAGVVTDYTEIGLLWSNIGRRTAFWLPAVAVPQVVLLGWVANHLFG